jgi:hypothetical protein
VIITGFISRLIFKALYDDDDDEEEAKEKEEEEV